MAKCANENCNNDPEKSPNAIVWSSDFDLACNQHCYNEAMKQMNYFCETILPNNGRYANWLGLKLDFVRKKWSFRR